MSTKKTDCVQVWRQQARAFAIETIKTYATGVIANYPEPKRGGRKKGEKIGASKTKLYAAILCSLYPRALKLKEVAEIAGVDQRVLLTWRTQKDFMDLIKKMSTTLGKDISTTIEDLIIGRLIETWKKSNVDGDIKDGTLQILKSKEEKFDVIKKSEDIKKVVIIDDTKKRQLPEDSIESTKNLIRMLSFTNGYVIQPVVDSLKKNSDDIGGGYTGLTLFAVREAHVYDEASLRDWESRPEILDLTKSMIEKHIEFLTDPETWKRGLESPEDREKILNECEITKRFIFEQLDLFTGNL